MELNKNLILILLIAILLVAMIGIFLIANPDQIPGLLNGLTIFAIALSILLLLLLPYLILAVGLVFGIGDKAWNFLTTFSLLALPWIIIGSGIIIVMTDNIKIIGAGWIAWYFIIPIVWFGSGIIFYEEFTK